MRTKPPPGATAIAATGPVGAVGRRVEAPAGADVPALERAVERAGEKRPVREERERDVRRAVRVERRGRRAVRARDEHAAVGEADRDPASVGRDGDRGGRGREPAGVEERAGRRVPDRERPHAGAGEERTRGGERERLHVRRQAAERPYGAAARPKLDAAAGAADGEQRRRRRERGDEPAGRVRRPAGRRACERAAASPFPSRTTAPARVSATGGVCGHVRQLRRLRRHVEADAEAARLVDGPREHGAVEARGVQRPPVGRERDRRSRRRRGRRTCRARRRSPGPTA